MINRARRCNSKIDIENTFSIDHVCVIKTTSNTQRNVKNDSKSDITSNSSCNIIVIVRE